jgi:hypothetical protein
MIIMDDIQKKIREELAKVQNSKFAKRTDAQLAAKEDLANDSTWKESQRQGVIEKWADPDFKKKRLTDFSKPEYIEKIKKVRKEVGNRTEEKEKKRKIAKDLHANPEFRQNYEKAIAERSARGPTSKQMESAKKAGEKRQRTIITPNGAVKTIKAMSELYGINIPSCQDRMKRKPHLYYYEDTGPGNPTFEDVVYTPYGVFPSRRDAMTAYTGDIKKGQGWWKKVSALYPDKFYIKSEVKREWKQNEN